MNRWTWAVYLAGLFAAAWVIGGWLDYSMGCNFATFDQPSKTCKVLKAFFDWQNAYGGIAAVAGALIGGRYILQQIQHSSDLAEQRRRSEEIASRAVLPLALASLSQYAQDCITFLDQNVTSDSYEYFPKKLPLDAQPPRLPDNVIGALQSSARFADPGTVAHIERSLLKLQLQQSRLLRWVRKTRGEFGTSGSRQHHGLDCMYDAAELYASLSVLFEYSRDEDLMRSRLPTEKVANALHNSGIWDNDHPIWKIVDARGNRPSQPL